MAQMVNRLQEYRRKAGKTQRQMAEALGIKTAAGYCKKELGYTPVTLEEAADAAEELGVTIEQLFFTSQNS